MKKDYKIIITPSSYPQAPDFKQLLVSYAQKYLLVISDKAHTSIVTNVCLFKKHNY